MAERLPEAGLRLIKKAAARRAAQGEATAILTLVEVRWLLGDLRDAKERAVRAEDVLRSVEALLDEDPCGQPDCPDPLCAIASVLDRYWNEARALATPEAPPAAPPGSER